MRNKKTVWLGLLLTSTCFLTEACGTKSSGNTSSQSAYPSSLVDAKVALPGTRRASGGTQFGTLGVSDPLSTVAQSASSANTTALVVTTPTPAPTTTSSSSVVAASPASTPSIVNVNDGETDSSKNLCTLTYSSTARSMSYTDGFHSFLMQAWINAQKYNPLGWLAQGGWGANFNFQCPNSTFMLSISIPQAVLQAGITGATLRAKVTSNGELWSNDGFYLFVFDGAQHVSTPLPQPPMISAVPNTVGYYGSDINAETNISLDLSALQNGSLTTLGTQSLIPAMQQQGNLNVYVEDDHAVNEVELQLNSPACKSE